MQTLKMNATAVRHPVRHICMPADQTIDRIYMQCNLLLNENNSIPQTVLQRRIMSSKQSSC